MRSFVFSVSLVICLSLTGQDYKPLVVQGNSWSVYWQSWGWGNTDYFLINGDTMINNVLYARLFVTPDSLLQTSFNYIGALREDTLEKEVYYFNKWESQERLLYKFGLDVGNTVTFWWEGCQVDLDVVDVDTLTDEMGIERRRMFMKSYFSNYIEEWIEGIGSGMGPVFPGHYMCVADLGFELLCYKYEEELYYMNPLYNTCHRITVGIDEKSGVDIEVKVIPNPVTGRSTIELPLDVSVQSMVVYDAFGRKVFMPDTDNTVIRNTQFPPGIYILKLEFAGKGYHSCKFVVR